MTNQGSALSEGLYWYAEKLMWGYVDVEKNPVEAFRIYQQAADLGSSDAYIRLGELYENGKDTQQNPGLALASYRRAIEKGNFLGYAFIAKL